MRQWNIENTPRLNAQDLRSHPTDLTRPAAGTAAPQSGAVVSEFSWAREERIGAVVGGPRRTRLQEDRQKENRPPFHGRADGNFLIPDS